MHLESDNSFRDDEGAGYIISISDMMSGLLFIFIITLVAFIINFQDAVQKQEAQKVEYEKTTIELEKRNQSLEREKKRQQHVTNAYAATIKQIIGAEALRKELLFKIQKELETRGVQVQIDTKHGVLRLTEQAIRFDTGSAELAQDQLKKIDIIGDTLSSILPCYTAMPPIEWVSNGVCSQETTGKLDSVFVEGHTDNTPVSGGNNSARYQNNWELSALRAIYTYQHLVPTHPLLSEMKNSGGLPVFSVSGYGEGRPVPGHFYDLPTSDIENRRIDLRFIMTPPSETEAEKALKAAGINR